MSSDVSFLEIQTVEENFYISEMPNGMTLLGQKMDHVSSAAMTLAIPAGAAYDPPGSEGAAAVSAEWCFRGAGQRDSRQLHQALDALGCQRHQSTQSEHLVFSTAQLGRNLADVLTVYADILCRTRLDAETFEPCRGLTLQDLAALEDEPAKKCNMMLREKFYPAPLGRCVYGTADSLKSLSPQTVAEHLRDRLGPRGTILAIAGKIDWPEFCDIAEEHFGDWANNDMATLQTQVSKPSVTHLAKDSAQTHIAIAYRSATIASKHYYAARMAETILSGGMSSRLFTEVREKRGLVYHVSCRYHSVKDHAGMFAYAGTTPAKAQETFDVIVQELRRLTKDIHLSEMDMARTQLKSSLIMHNESTESRSASLVSDWYHLRRLRSLSELSQAIDNVTIDDVLAYLREYPAGNFTVLVIGPQSIEPSATSE